METGVALGVRQFFLCLGISPRNDVFFVFMWEYARSSGENEEIPEKRQRSPLIPNFYCIKVNSLEIGDQQRWEECFVLGAPHNIQSRRLRFSVYS
ncbi:hypothetical protein [Paenibacillus jiagnxiensis]|uniref:hypothetical protein n=1 Tax=Paenibacillus jiagnxiensis TaxID=3228926 RepID=UPI0033A82B49